MLSYSNDFVIFEQLVLILDLYKEPKGSETELV